MEIPPGHRILVCSGQLTDHYAELQRSLTQLRLAEQVQFLGFVPEPEVAGLYADARLLVMPTRFEAGSFPVWEAFAAGVPVVCSTVTSLPEQVGDAGLLVDPLDAAAMAAAIRRLWEDDGLRADLVQRGRRRLSELSWTQTARRMRAVYREVAGHADDGPGPSGRWRGHGCDRSRPAARDRGRP